MLQRASVNTEERLQMRLNPQINTCGAGAACRPTSGTLRTRTSVVSHSKAPPLPFLHTVDQARWSFSFLLFFFFFSRKLSALLSSLWFFFFFCFFRKKKTQPGERKLGGHRMRRLNSVVCDAYQCCSWRVCVVVHNALVVINPPSWPHTETMCSDLFLRCLARPFLFSLYHFFFFFSLPGTAVPVCASGLFSFAKSGKRTGSKKKKKNDFVCWLCSVTLELFNEAASKCTARPDTFRAANR